jgi:beta-lactamase superfamily II metal-dependent hydrolase
MVGTVTVRMFNVGFGDCFLVTVERAGARWRMLVDCGVHPHGARVSIHDTVVAVTQHLAETRGDGPDLDVIVATHRHADHISGFADPAWADIAVGEVWLPYVENPDDPATRIMREGLDRAGSTLAKLTAGPRWDGVSLSQRDSHGLAVARLLAANSSKNTVAMSRLLGQDGLGFAGQHQVRFLPDADENANRIAVGLPRAHVHVFGPSRDPTQLGRMNPPAGTAWLRLAGMVDASTSEATAPAPPMFADVYKTPRPRTGPMHLAGFKRRIVVPDTDAADVLAAASILERAVNNTSVFFLLDVAGTRLVFPGDAQQGAWDHVLGNPAARVLLGSAVFYKIGHHGSHNASPREFVERVLPASGYAMLPWGQVKQWPDIPKQELLDALDARHETVIRADNPTAVLGSSITASDDLSWAELVLTTE